MAIGRENSARFLRVLIIISISSFSSSLTHTESDVQDQPNLLPCNHDEIAEKNPYRVNLASQGGRTRDKRQLTYSNIRIHPVLTYISYSANEFVQGNDSLLSKAIDTLQSILSVHPVQGNLTLPPMCTEYTDGLNEGKCMAPLPSQDNYRCGPYGVIPPEYIGTREVCNSSNGSCTIQGPDGPGLPNADYLLFVSASFTFSCNFALAYASYCALDISDKNRPVVGYIHMCTSFLEDFREQPDIIYETFMHEIIHALGFSSRLFEKFVDTNGNNYNPAISVTGPYGSTYAFTGPKTMEFAKQYYGCDDIQGVYLENQGGSGTASSHWERRTLQHEVMNGYISSDYSILSEFTIALFEDSGWYKANYAALYNLKQNPLQWGKGLGCPFLTEPCTNHSAFPYLCDTSETELLCTYDHLSKGNCSTRWAGFDGCPVAVASEIQHYCRTNATVNTVPLQHMEVYGDNSVCVDAVRSLSCSTLGRSICVAHEAYTVNGINQYALQIENKKYECEDGQALFTDSYFIVLCPPKEEIILRSPSVSNVMPALSPSTTIAVDDLDTLENIIHSYKNIVAFGELFTLNSVNISYFINLKQNNGINFICQLFGCTECTNPFVVYDSTTILSNGTIYSVARGIFAASAVFTHSLTQSSDYTLVLMLDPQAYHAFVYYAASIDFVGSYLQALHSNDESFMKITALSSYTEIRIVPSQDVKINGSSIFHREEIIFMLNIGETVMVSSSEDLTGSRVTASNSVLFHSGHYCASGKTTNCGILNEQIPPYNSWGNTFTLHTNVNEVKGNMLKIIASDVGAYVSMNCTTDGANYEASNFNLGFRQHMVLSVSRDYCTIKSDENILIVQFSDSSPPLMDTFMTIIPAMVHFEDSYVLNAHEGFNNYIAITIKDYDPTKDYLMINNNPVIVAWKMLELDGDTYYFGTVTLTGGRYKVSFLLNFIEFGVMLYGSNKNGAYSFPAGMKINIIETFTSAVPGTVQNALVTVVGKKINVTWSPPFTSTEMILQYIVKRINSSGKSYHYVSGNQNYLELPYFTDALVFIAAVNQYAQSSYELAKSSAPCLPSPCVNNRICVIVNIYDYYCDCGDLFFGEFCESTQKLYPFGFAHNDILLPSVYASTSLMTLSDEITFYTTKTRLIYINMNGVISLDAPYTTNYPRSLPLRGYEKIIAPFWAAIDTRGTGQIFYRETTEPRLLARASNDLQEAFHMSQNVTITNLFIATWNGVGYYYKRTDKTNTFQCVLARSQYESFAMFLYADVQWPTYAYGALAGINVGDSFNYATVFGSRTSNIVNIEETSNIGIPGIWIFKIGEDCQPSIHTCVSEFYPFGLTHGDTALESSYGQGRSPLITLSRNFYFYEEALRVVYINDNGVISFDYSFYTRTPVSLPLSGSQKIIAPYWADVDINGTGEIFYRESTDPSLLARASREVQKALSMTKKIEIKSLLIATWNAVGYYYLNTDKVNTFQCILATSEKESFVMFLYADLQWTTGSASSGRRGLGGSEALAGFNAGDRLNSYTIDGSQTPRVVKLTRTSNVDMPGTWIFKVGEDCFRQAVKDVVFVIHTGSNIGSTRFQIVRELLENITINIKSNSPETQFGLITYDEIARFEFDISKHTDLSTLLPAINPGLPYYGGYGTNITSALNLLLSGGMQGGYLQLRDKISKLAIVITAGYSSSYTQLRSVASSLHATNIFDDVYAVGIGGHSYSDLRAIASNPSFVITTGYLSSSTAPQLLANIVKQLCFAYAPKIFLRPNFSQQGVVGEPYDLVCTIALSSKVQTSSVNLTWDFTSNDNRVTVIPTTITTDDSIVITYTTVIKFAYVTEADEGDYTCTLMIEKEHLKESTFYFDIIYPITAIQLFSDSIPTVYQPLILQCEATIVRGITSTVDIIWTTGDTQVRRINNITPSSNINSLSVYNDLFIIPSLDISDIGNTYQCEVFVNSILPTIAKADFIIPIPGSRCLGDSVLDVVFVIDTSGSIGSSNFQLIRDFTANVTTELINNSPNSAVGVILFATNAHLVFNLQSYTSLDTLLSAINQLPYSSGGTDTAEALRLLLATAQNGTLGLRSDSSKVAIVITDGHSNSHSATLSAAAALHASNIFDIYAIGVGGADVTELDIIASNSKFVFSTSRFDSTSVLGLQNRILIICNGDFLNITLLQSENTVGQQQDVICTLSVPPDVNPNSIELGWFYEDDIITDDNRITINTSNNYYFDSTLVTVIHFNWLAEDDEDEYTCYAIMNGSFIFRATSLQNFKIPIPLAQITIFNNEMLENGNLTIGDPLTVVCTVTAVRGITSSVDLTWIIRKRTSISTRVYNVTAKVEKYSAIYTDSIEISSLSAIDNGVEYQCRARINAKQTIYSNSDTFTLIFNAPVCFMTSYCGGESVGNRLLTFSHCCFELSGISFASPGLCFQCPIDEICQPDTATCVTEFYNFGLPENDSVLSYSIDSTSRSITLSEIFFFFGQTIKTVYVSDNGIVSLNKSYNTWSPRLLPINGTQFIAPYWADFDLTGFGQVFYRQTKDPVLLARATNEIQRAFPLSQNTTVINLFIVTWDSVGYYRQGTDKTNTLQCVLATTPLKSFVIFLYADGRIQWTTGDGSGGIGGLGGIEAVAGINAGDGVNSITIPGSLSSKIINVTKTSNVGTPGVWMFKVGEDFNECLINNGECDHICRNLPGSYECSCNTSYILAADNKTCYHVTNDCFYVLVEPSGYINTTGFPNLQYASNSSCTWTISLSQFKNIELKFEAMAIEDSPNCVKDSVTIFNGKGEDSLALGSYCGNKLPATIISSTEIVTITFTSDNTVNNQGFRLHYRGLTERSKGVYQCNTVISKTTKFALPTFPSKYNGPIDCVYYFTFPRRTNKMKLTFLYLDILAADCSTERIEIYDGLSASTSSEKICNGNKLLEFMSSNNYVKMTFIGKSVGKYRGFHAKVTFS